MVSMIFLFGDRNLETYRKLNIGMPLDYIAAHLVFQGPPARVGTNTRKISRCLLRDQSSGYSTSTVLRDVAKISTQSAPPGNTALYVGVHLAVLYFLSLPNGDPFARAPPQDDFTKTSTGLMSLPGHGLHLSLRDSYHCYRLPTINPSLSTFIAEWVSLLIGVCSCQDVKLSSFQGEESRSL